MKNKLTPLNEFIIFDDANEPIFNELGLPTFLPFPVTKTVEDIERVIALGKDLEVITEFAEQVALGEQWLWASKYYDYLVELNEVEQYNANLPTFTNEEGKEVEVESLPVPEAPAKPTLKTAEEVLEPYQKQITKALGIEFKGVNVSLNESNQNGLSALKSALELSKEFEVSDQFFPINFNAETCDGTQVLTLVDEAEFKEFGLQFVMARKAFFE